MKVTITNLRGITDEEWERVEDSCREVSGDDL
jgi:hypothetical protein